MHTPMWKWALSSQRPWKMAWKARWSLARWSIRSRIFWRSSILFYQKPSGKPVVILMVLICNCRTEDIKKGFKHLGEKPILDDCMKFCPEYHNADKPEKERLQKIVADCLTHMRNGSLRQVLRLFGILFCLFMMTSSGLGSTVGYGDRSPAFWWSAEPRQVPV